MAFYLLLIISLAVCVIGLGSRAFRWFAGGVTSADRDLPAAVRAARTGRAVIRALFGVNVFRIFQGIDS